MTQWITEFILFFKDLSYAGIVIALSFEFVPAELILPLAGYWVYLGDMKLVLTILAGTVGGTFGPLTLYAIGRFGGRPFIEKYGKYIFIRPHHLVASDRFFEKYGSGVAFYGRFIPGVRTLISVPCGMAKMNVLKFSIYTFWLCCLSLHCTFTWDISWALNGSMWTKLLSLTSFRQQRSSFCASDATSF